MLIIDQCASTGHWENPQQSIACQFSLEATAPRKKLEEKQSQLQVDTKWTPVRETVVIVFPGCSNYPCMPTLSLCPGRKVT